MSNNPTLILVRHAHRDTSNRELDNGLSDKGLKQVHALEKQLIRYLGAEEIKESTFLSSPKKRCIETLFGLSTFSNLGLKIDSRLDEQGSIESNKNFSSRAHQMIKSVTQLDGIHLWCSHGDWIPMACFFLIEASLPVKKGSALVFVRSREGRWELIDTILTKS